MPNVDSPGVAARRRRGARANWSTDAKVRAFLIAESCVKKLCAECRTDDGEIKHVTGCTCSPYRVAYDDRREATTSRVHAVDCVRCGPSGRPAEAGTPWNAGHLHADALRIASKTILKDVWIAARDLYAANGWT